MSKLSFTVTSAVCVVSIVNMSIKFESLFRVILSLAPINIHMEIEVRSFTTAIKNLNSVKVLFLASFIAGLCRIEEKAEIKSLQSASIQLIWALMKM